MRGEGGSVLWWRIQLHAAEGAEEKGRSKTHHGVLMAKHPAPKRYGLHERVVEGG